MRHLVRRRRVPARAGMELLQRPLLVPAPTYAFVGEDVESAVARGAEEVSHRLFLQSKLFAGAPNVAEHVLDDLGSGVARADESIGETAQRVAVCPEHRLQRSCIARAHARGAIT